MTDLIEIGGGLVGGAIAWSAEARGADVILFDEGDMAFRAARCNFGLVWVQGEGAGMPWPSLTDRLGTDTAFASRAVRRSTCPRRNARRELR